VTISILSAGLVSGGHSPTRVSGRATGRMAAPGDGAGVVSLRGADLSALGVVKAIAERRISDTEQDDELAPSLDIPLFAVEKVLSVRPRGRKDGGEDTRRSSTTSSPGRGGSARVSNEPTFMSGVYDDAPGTSGRAPLHGRREGRREFLAAACTSDANARPGDPTATRVLHAAALASEEGTRHDLLLRSEGAGASEFADDPGDASPPTARVLPWYHGADARITSMEFSPLCAEARPNNRGGSTPPRMLLCGTEGGGVYVVAAGALLSTGAGEGDARTNQASTTRGVRVLCTSGSRICSVLWWRRHAVRSAGSDVSDGSSDGGAGSSAGSSASDNHELVAVACAQNGEVRFWNPTGDPVCAVFVGGRAAGAAVVDTGASLGQYLLVSGFADHQVTGNVNSNSTSFSAHSTDRTYTSPNAHWTLQLERRGASLPSSAGKRGFSPARLADGRFGACSSSSTEKICSSNAVLSVHPGAHDTSVSMMREGDDSSASPGGLSTTLVARLGAGSPTLALFHPSNDRVSIATYRVPDGTTAVRVTRRLIFALHRAKRGGRARLAVLVRRETDEGSGLEPKPLAAGSADSRGAKPGGFSASGGTELAQAGTGAGPGPGPGTLWRNKEIVPVVLQELTLSASVGRPLERALMSCGDRRGETNGGGGVTNFEGCAVATQGATLVCRPSTPSTETLVRGLLGTAKGPEADAFAAAMRRAVGKESSRRQSGGDDEFGDGAVLSARTVTRGDFKAETLLLFLGMNSSHESGLYTEAVHEAARVGDIARAARLAPRASANAPVATCVAACLREWRAADALDYLDRLDRGGYPTTRASRDLETHEETAEEQEQAHEKQQGVFLRLCCATHLELSAWAAATAAAAIRAAGAIAEEHPDTEFPWPSGALSPPLAATAAEALANVAKTQTPGHKGLGSLEAAARCKYFQLPTFRLPDCPYETDTFFFIVSAARLAAAAAAGVTAFVDADVFAAERGGDETKSVFRARVRLAAIATLRVALAAGSAADTFHNGGQALRQFVEYSSPGGGAGGSRGEEDDFFDDDDLDESAARSPCAAARAVAYGALVPHASGDISFDCAGAVVAVLPLMRPEEVVSLAAVAGQAIGPSRANDALATGAGAAEIRVAALLCLVANTSSSSRDTRGISPAGDTASTRGYKKDLRYLTHQRDLEETLREGLRHQKIRPQWAVAAALGWNNGSAAAVVLGCVGDWIGATRCRLRFVDDAIPSSNHTRNARDQDAETETELVATLALYATRAETATTRAAAIGAVCVAWRARCLSATRLETVLLTELDLVGTEALTLLLRHDRAARRRAAFGESECGARDAADDAATNHENKPAWFSASFALAVALLRVEAASRDAGHGVREDFNGVPLTGDTKHDHDDARMSASTRKESDESRWSRARAALCADAGQSTCIRWHAAPVVAAAEGESLEPPESPGQESETPGPLGLPTPSPKASGKVTDACVFSCGHVLPVERLAFAAAAFAGKLKRSGCPMSSELVAAEYALNQCALACPDCVSRAVHATYGVGGARLAVNGEYEESEV